MPFLIHNKDTESFMVLVHPNIISWTTEPMNAKKFSNLVKANNFLNNNFHFFPNTTNIDLSSLHVVDSKELGTETHGTPEKAVTAERSLSLSPASPSLTESESHSVHNAVSHTASHPMPNPVELDIDDVGNLLADLPEMISRLCAIEGRLIQALTCCANAISQADMETEDILHKIEFVRADVVQGYHLYKDLHDCRLQRRKAKDLMTLLGLIQTSGLLNRVESFRVSYESYQNTLSHRSYHPRVRNDLFFPKPVASKSDLPPEESYVNG